MCPKGIRKRGRKPHGRPSDPPSLKELYISELVQRAKLRSVMEPDAILKTQLWRLQDLRDGACVFTLELFITAVTIQLSGDARSPRLVPRDVANAYYDQEPFRRPRVAEAARRAPRGQLPVVG